MRRALAAAAVVLVVACGQENVDAAKALRDGAAAMAQVKTLAATLKMTKGTITIQGFTLVSARTSVRLPSDSDTFYVVKEQDVSFGLEVVMASGRVFLHLPFTPYQELKGTQAAAFPDMAKLFNSSTGLPAVIPQGSGPKYVSSDQVGGTDSYQVSATYTADQVRSLLSELSSSGPVGAHVWVGKSDHLIRKATLDGAFGDQGKEAAVEVDITNFNGTVSITSPTP